MRSYINFLHLWTFLWKFPGVEHPICISVKSAMDCSCFCSCSTIKRKSNKQVPIHSSSTKKGGKVNPHGILELMTAHLRQK